MKKSMTNSEPKSNSSVVQSSFLRKRAIINLFVMPIYLVVFGALAFILWQVSIKWAAATDMTTKLIWGTTGVFLILLEIVIGYYVRRFSNWVFSGKSDKKEAPSKDRNE